jgi:hypothetical protein
MRQRFWGFALFFRKITVFLVREVGSFVNPAKLSGEQE